jgi:hypothetical protein
MLALESVSQHSTIIGHYGLGMKQMHVEIGAVFYSAVIILNERKLAMLLFQTR